MPAPHRTAGRGLAAVTLAPSSTTRAIALAREVKR